jgi:hypothetical protein
MIQPMSLEAANWVDSNPQASPEEKTKMLLGIKGELPSVIDPLILERIKDLTDSINRPGDLSRSDLMIKISRLRIALLLENLKNLSNKNVEEIGWQYRKFYQDPEDTGWGKWCFIVGDDDLRIYQNFVERNPELIQLRKVYIEKETDVEVKSA